MAPPRLGPDAIDAMQPSDRERLEARKRRLQAKLARAREGEYLRPLIPVLRQSPVRASRLGVRALTPILAPVMALEGRGERVDWSRLSGGVCGVWTTRPERDALFRTALADLTRPDDRVVVVWHPLSAGLRLRAVDADRLAPQILDAAPEAWVIPADRPGWLIEAALFDQELCYASGLIRPVS